MTSRTALLVAGFGVATAAVTAGVYLNFTARVMPSLGRLSDPAGIARMQAFNRTAVQPPFMLCFFGAALAGGYLIVRVARGDRSAADLLLAAGGAAYLAGFLLTIGYNVPLNDRLARLDPHAASSVAVWRGYLRDWTAANSVRAGLSMLACVLLISGGIAAMAGQTPDRAAPARSAVDADV